MNSRDALKFTNALAKAGNVLVVVGGALEGIEQYAGDAQYDAGTRVFRASAAGAINAAGAGTGAFVGGRLAGAWCAATWTGGCGGPLGTFVAIGGASVAGGFIGSLGSDIVIQEVLLTKACSWRSYGRLTVIAGGTVVFAYVAFLSSTAPAWLRIVSVPMAGLALCAVVDFVFFGRRWASTATSMFVPSIFNRHRTVEVGPRTILEVVEIGFGLQFFVSSSDSPDERESITVGVCVSATELQQWVSASFPGAIASQ